MVKFLENWKTLGRVGTNSYFKIPIIFVKALTNTDIVVFCQKSIIFGTDGIVKDFTNLCEVLY